MKRQDRYFYTLNFSFAIQDYIIETDIDHFFQAVFIYEIQKIFRSFQPDQGTTPASHYIFYCNFYPGSAAGKLSAL